MSPSILLLASLSLFPAAPPDPPEGGVTIWLWEGKAPLAVSDSQFDKPLLTLFKAPAEKANGAAVVVCPGGGYGTLATDHEGKQIAEFYNALGVHAFVLQYRIVRAGRPGPLLMAPLLDVQRAIRTVRSQAKEMKIDPKRVGLMGFSAGGHLASTGGTHFDEGKADGDAIDKFSCRPDFLVLGYPVVSMEAGVTHGGSRNNLLGMEPDAKTVEFFSNEKQVTAKTPPTFIFHTDEDKAVLPENAVRFYLALKKAKVPAEMHIYEKGRHGVGLRGEPYCDDWGNHLTKWLKHRGVFDQAKE
jgi:acetyl esterase/lipase